MIEIVTTYSTGNRSTDQLEKQLHKSLPIISYGHITLFGYIISFIATSAHERGTAGETKSCMPASAHCVIAARHTLQRAQTSVHTSCHNVMLPTFDEACSR